MRDPRAALGVNADAESETPLTHQALHIDALYCLATARQIGPKLVEDLLAMAVEALAQAVQQAATAATQDPLPKLPQNLR